jgi:glycosyltransferase involved in cell wall biosynthesis
LEETLFSVFNQTWPEIEIIAVDDGSRDRSLEILARYPDRIRVVRQANSGPAVARNRGVREARGNWIAFIDADDTWQPEKIEKQAKICRQKVWSYTDSIFVGGVNGGRRDSEFTPKHKGYILEALVRSNFISTSSVMIERQIFLDFGGFEESLRSIEDWDLWIRIASRHEAAYIDEPLLGYRVHPTSTSRNSRATLPNHFIVIDRAFRPNGPAGHLHHLKRVSKAESSSTCSFIAEEEQDFGYALKCALLACRYYPYDRFHWKRLIRISSKILIKLLSPMGIRVKSKNCDT